MTTAHDVQVNDEVARESPEIRISHLSLLVSAALAVRLAIAALPLRDLIVYAMPDDAFYYFTIARNVSDGRNVTFDGETITNGFHPLWMLATSACYLLPVSDDVAMRLALVASALVSGTATIAIFRVAIALGQQRHVALMVAAVYALHPATILAGVNGLETGFLLATALWTVERVSVMFTADRLTNRWAMSVGVVGALLILARTDYALVLLPVLALAVRTAGRRNVLIAFTVTGTLVAPWFVWSFIATGDLSQTSAQAVPLVAHWNGPDGLAAVRHSVELIWQAWSVRLPSFYLSPWTDHLVGAVTALVIAGVVVIVWRMPIEREREYLFSLLSHSLPLSH